MCLPSFNFLELELWSEFNDSLSIHLQVYLPLSPRSKTHRSSNKQVTKCHLQNFRLRDQASGFVFGALTISNLVDVHVCKRLLALAKGRPCTFHRAFDLIPSGTYPIHRYYCSTKLKGKKIPLLTLTNRRDSRTARHSHLPWFHFHFNKWWRSHSRCWR